MTLASVIASANLVTECNGKWVTPVTHLPLHSVTKFADIYWYIDIYIYLYIYRSNLCRSVWKNYKTYRDDRPLIRKLI